MTQFEDLPETVVGHILSRCNLQTIGRVARLNRFFKARVDSNSSLALAEKFSVGDYKTLKTILSKLPPHLLTKVRNDTLSLEDALKAILPPYYLYQIELYASYYKKFGISLMDVMLGFSSNRNAFDYAADKADLSIFDAPYDDGAPANVVFLMIMDYFNLLNPRQPISNWNAKLLKKPKTAEEADANIMDALVAHLPDEFKESVLPSQMDGLIYLCSPAAHYAVATGKLNPVSMKSMSKDDLLLTIVNANLPPHYQLENWEVGILPFLMQKNTLSALARNLVQITDFANLLEEMKLYMSLALTDLGMPLLEEAGSFAALRALAPTQLQLLCSMYDEEMTYGNPNPISCNHVHLPYLGTFETKQCVKEKLISLHDLVKHEGHFSLWYLLLSELGMKCLREKTLTVESALKLHPPSKLAEKILELNRARQAVVACTSNDDDNKVSLLNNRHA